MKTYINYQPFKLEGTDGLLNTPKAEELKTWKTKLADYRYLHNMGVVLSKANRSQVFETLEILRENQDDLVKLIEARAESRKRDEIKERIEQLQERLQTLSLLRDESTEEYEHKPQLMTMQTFNYNKGKRLTLIDNSKLNAHNESVQKVKDAIAKRKASEKKEAKA